MLSGYGRHEVVGPQGAETKPATSAAEPAGGQPFLDPSFGFALNVRVPDQGDRQEQARHVQSIASASHGAKRDAGMLLLPTSRPARRVGYWLWLRVVLVVVAVAQRRLGPSSSATTSTIDRALLSSAVQLRCWSRPTTTIRLPSDRDSAICSAWSRHTTTVKNDASCSRGPLT